MNVLAALDTCQNCRSVNTKAKTIVASNLVPINTKAAFVRLCRCINCDYLTYEIITKDESKEYL
jgi:hypothetical protein